MLVYPKERHDLAKEPHQKDLAHRIQNWFDYYLKDKSPEPWILEMKK
jgi:dipeptidyl aminopeptidase/acylaminoacyl peptidase